MRTKKKTVEQRKQKQPEIREISPVDGREVSMEEKIFGKDMSLA